MKTKAKQYQTQAMSCLYICKIKDVFLYLKGRITESEGENDLSTDSLPRWPPWSVLGQAEVRVQELHLVCLVNGRSPSTWVILHCPSQVISRELERPGHSWSPYRMLVLQVVSLTTLPQ